MSRLIVGATVGTGTDINNFYDCSGCSNGTDAAATVTGTQGRSTISGNLNMVAGGSVTPNQSWRHSLMGGL